MIPVLAADELRLVLTTCADLARAEACARALLEARLASCVSIVPGCKSMYWWQGELQTSSECQLLIKTALPKLVELARQLPGLTGFEVPELLALPISEAGTEYLDWLLVKLRSP